MADTTPGAQIAVDSAKQVFDSTNKVMSDKGLDPRAAMHIAADKAGDHLAELFTEVLRYTGAVGYGVTAIKTIFDTITQAKIDNRPEFDKLTAAVVSDLLQVEVKPQQTPAGSGPETAQQMNHGLGSPLVAQLEAMFLNGSDPTKVDGEQAARTMLGFGLNFAVTAGFMSVLPEVLSLGHLKDWSEIGEELQGATGLGRLTRLALRPLVRNAIQQPYERKMRAKYRQDLISPAELVLAMTSGRMDAATVKERLAEHGYSDDQITEIITQKTPRLSAEELFILGLFHEAPSVGALTTLVDDGVPTDTATRRLRYFQLKAAHAVEQRYVQQVDSLVLSRTIDTTTASTLLQGTTLSEDEVKQYQQKWDLSLNNPTKRLNFGEMLFLFETAQVTIAEVGNWAAAEGYTAEAQQQLLLYFELKATANAQGKAKSAAAAAAHVHAEHVAYVKDVFEGAQGKPPTDAQLAGWVALLDNRQRTRGDVKTEVKLNPNPPTQ